MSIERSANGTIELKGSCSCEDAEILLQHLLAAPDASVDWSSCESAHTAVIQVLLVAKSLPRGSPLNAFLRDKVAPTLKSVAA